MISGATSTLPQVQLPQIQQAQQAPLPQAQQPHVQPVVAMPSTLGLGRDDDVLDLTYIGAKSHFYKSIVPLKEKFNWTAENFIILLSGETERA